MDAADNEPVRGSRTGTQALDRAVSLLHAVAQASPRESTVASLAHRCGLTKATTWRLLTGLESHGLVDRDPGAGTYAIGFSMFELASSVRPDGLVTSARPILRGLADASGETANIAVYSAPTLRYVDEVRPNTVVAASWSGRTSSLHATSTGKAVLAWLPDDETSALLSGELVAHTPRTLVAADALRDDLGRTRRRGYATCVGEFESGLNGVSVPLLDGQGRPIVVLSVWGADHRVPSSRLRELGSLVRDAAADLANRRPALSPAG